MKVHEGNLSAEGKKFAIVAGRFHEFLTKNLLDGAVDCIKRHGGSEENIEVTWVPGALEIPFAARKMASKKFDAIICIAVVVRGATPHSEYVAGQVTRSIGQINAEGVVPLTSGVIIADTIEHAIERSGTKMGNKGWQAALSAIEMANLNTVLR